MTYELSENERLILKIIREYGPTSETEPMPVSELVERCAMEGLTDQTALQMALMSLIDHDVVDYEMDENMQANEFWLL